MKRLIFCAVLASLFALAGCGGGEPSPNELYRLAVIDAMTIEKDEIFPVLRLVPEENRITWDEEGRALMLTFHAAPEIYIAGEEVTLPGEVWTVTDRETLSWFIKNREGVRDWRLRLSQFVGVPADSGYTHMTAMWVNPADCLRPAYNSDVTSNEVLTAFPEDVNPEYEAWFRENILYSYFDSAYPWTRLGYTYDWADNGSEYGACEFLVEKGAAVEIVYTDTASEFVARLSALAEGK